jgi:hypothetical protein
LSQLKLLQSRPAKNIFAASSVARFHPTMSHGIPLRRSIMRWRRQLLINRWCAGSILHKAGIDPRGFAVRKVGGVQGDLHGTLYGCLAAFAGLR